MQIGKGIWTEKNVSSMSEGALVKEPEMIFGDEPPWQIVGSCAQLLYEVCVACAWTVIVGILVSMIPEQALEISRESRPTNICGVTSARLSTAAVDTAGGATVGATELVVLPAGVVGDVAEESSGVA